MSDEAYKNDHEMTLIDLVPPMEGAAFTGTYRTLSAILQFHIKRLYISGTLEDPDDLYREIKRISPRTLKEDVDRFLADNLTSEDWIKSREVFLQKKLERELEDRQKLATRIDEIYDIELDKVRGIASRALDEMKEMGGDISVGRLKSLTETLRMSYEAQRLARGMVQGIQQTNVKEEGGDYKKRLEELENVMKARTVEGKVLEPQ
jgi:hypothetical protein